MTLLISGCSFSSGWGLDNPAQTWPNRVSRALDLDLQNLAETSASNSDIFLAGLKQNNYSLRLIQWTALNRITVSPSPINSRIVLSYHNQFLAEALPEVGSAEIKKFTQILSLLNQDWKPFFDLIDMIQVLQQDPNTYFINGLLPWDHEFFAVDWTVPLQGCNKFLEFLLQTEQFDNGQLKQLLAEVLQARNCIDKSRWINLEHSWDLAKVDTVSATDPHPGIRSQQQYANQVLNFLKEKVCQI